MQENINICFLMGKIISEIDFKFFYNSKKHVSIVKFIINTYKENAKVLIKAYDDVADNIYKEYNINSSINLVGFIEKNEVIIKEIF